MEQKRKTTHACLECPFETDDLKEAKDHAVEKKHYAWGVRYTKTERE